MFKLLVAVTMCLGLVSTASAAKPGAIHERGNVASTSFEDINGDRSDASDFFVGGAFFTDGAAGTRGFPPGYRTGDFVWITGFGTSSILMADESNYVMFWSKDIAELTPDVVGILLITYQSGETEMIEVPERYTRYVFHDVTRIDIMSTGVTNIDDFMYVCR